MWANENKNQPTWRGRVVKGAELENQLSWVRVEF